MSAIPKVSFLLIVLLFNFSYSAQIKNKDLNPNTKQKISFEKQISLFEELGYILKKGVDKQFLLGFITKEYGIQDALLHIEENPYSVLYYTLAQQELNIEGYYLTDQHFFYVLDYFEQPIAYKSFMLRMGIISDGELKFENIEVDFDEKNIKWISFTVNGISKKWHLGEGDFVDDSFIQRFFYLTEELSTAGRFTYYDRGGEDFIIDYATEQEQLKFNEVTGLNRIWLGEGNHFAEPTK